MPLIDISPALSPQTAVWPGDLPLEREVALAFARGDHLELSALRSTVHVGAHADAPSHYRGGFPDIASRSLDLYFGRCEVRAVSADQDGRIYPSALSRPPGAPRLLLKTGTFPDPDRFDTNFASLSPALVAWAHDHGVCLLGIDTPSVDPFDSKALESHNAIADRDMAILEGLVLEHVPDGIYTLIALPLKLVGFDASPVRAALLPASDGG